MMYAYRILYVEDEIEEARGRLASFFPDLKEPLEMCDDRNDIQVVLDEQCPFVDFEDTLEGALSKLTQGARRYLLFIVDRDLGQRQVGSIDTIKKVWPTISEDVYADDEHRSGDLILEYLLLEAGLRKKRLLRQFFFLTGHEKLEKRQELRSVLATLSAMHFSEADRKELIVGKSKPSRLKELEKAVHDPIRIHIQEKHNTVFTALRAVAPGLSLDADEYASALIDAFSKTDGVALAEQEPRRPDISTLRDLGDKIQVGIKRIASLKWAANDAADDMISRSLRVLKEHYDNPKTGASFRIEDLKVPELFYPPTHFIFDEKIKRDAEKIRRDFRHIHDGFELLTAVASQEVHRSQSTWCLGYRLHLMIYVICELLLFYHAKLLPEDG